jgi:hypothetical protein
MKLFRLIVCLSVLLLPAMVAFPQGVRHQDMALESKSVSGIGTVIVSQPNAIISFCNAPANAVPCTNKAATYTNSTLAVACPSNQQVVLAGTSTCVAAADSRGNWGVWAAPGQYEYTVTTANGVSSGPIPVTLGGSGGSGGGVAGANRQVQFNDANTFGALQGFEFDKTTGNLTIPGSFVSTSLLPWSVEGSFGTLPTPGANKSVLGFGPSGKLMVNENGTGLVEVAKVGGANLLTTKGDLFGFNGTSNARVPAGADGLCLKADSAASVGVSYSSCSTNQNATSIQGRSVSATAPTLDRQPLVWNSGASQWEPGISKNWILCANDTTTGTTAGRLAHLIPDTNKCITARTTDTLVEGICISGCGTTGTAVILVQGQTTLRFDNAAVKGHTYLASATNGGQATDHGDQLVPQGSQFLGFVVDQACSPSCAANSDVLVDIDASHNFGFATSSYGGRVQLAGDLGGTDGRNPTVVATHLSAALPIAQGGTGQTTAIAAFNALAPGTAKGGLIAGTGANTYSNLAVGSDGQVLIADSTQSTGLRWGAGGGGSSNFTCSEIDNGLCLSAVDGSNNPNFIAQGTAGNKLTITGTSLIANIDGAQYTGTGTYTDAITGMASSSFHYVYVKRPPSGTVFSGTDFAETTLAPIYSYTQPACSATTTPQFWFDLGTNKMKSCVSSGSFSANPAVFLGVVWVTSTPTVSGIAHEPFRLNPYQRVQKFGDGMDGGSTLVKREITSGTTTEDGFHQYASLEITGGTLQHSQMTNNVSGNTAGLYVYSQNPILVVNSAAINANSKGSGTTSGGTGTGTAGTSGLNGASGGGGGGGTSAGGAGGSHRNWNFVSNQGGGTAGTAGNPGGNGSNLTNSGNPSMVCYAQFPFGGAPGGSGGGDGTNSGASGAAGGGMVLIHAPAIVVDSTSSITANGGNGSNAAAGNTGGGGGGGGGAVILCSSYLSNAGTISANGGTGGTGSGTGGAGGNGGTGLVQIVRSF